MTLGAIDCGLGGAVAWFNQTGVHVKNMPKDDLELNNLLNQAFKTGDKVYVEYQSMRAGDGKSGKFFNTSKLIVNYKQILMLLRIAGVQTEIITAHEWQKKYDLPLDYADKKKKLVGIAKTLYPALKPSLKTADALLILNHVRLINQYAKK
jgi:hypothetical protein